MHRPFFPRALLLSLLTLAAIALFTTGGLTQEQFDRVMVNGRQVASARGEVLVKFRTPGPLAARLQLRNQIDADRDQEVGRLGVTRFHSKIFDAETLLSFFRTLPNVEYAEPNYVLQATALPNDPQFGQLWGLLNVGQAIAPYLPGTAGADIKAVPAWDISTGSRANVVAVIDTGIDYTHPDLAANVWSAPANFTVIIAGQSITCAAGTHGFNARTMTCNPMDDNDHGTHVAGTIGAVGNNGVGAAGVNWTASIMGSKFLNASGSGTTADAINAIEFVIQAKSAFAGTGGANVRVLSNSWGGGGFSPSLFNEILRANQNNMLFVAAAGNSTSNNDITPSFPSGYNVPNVVAVAATDSDDSLAYFSNFGPTSVDLAAPGNGILSTTLGNTYQVFNGTSMAVPHVSGAALLVLSTCSLDTAGLKANLLQHVDPIPSLNGITVTGGRLNVDNSVRACSPLVPPAAPTGLLATASPGQVALTWTAVSGATSYTVKRGTARGSEVTLASGVLTPSYLDTTVGSGTTYFYVVTAVNGNGESAPSNERSVPLVPPGAPTGLLAIRGPGQVSLTWTAASEAASYTVKRGTASGTEVALAPGVLTASYVDTAVTNGTTYFYVITAVNGAGESGPSNERSATPLAPPAAPTGLLATRGQVQVSLTWTAVSGATSYTVKRGTASGGETTLATGVLTPSYVDTTADKQTFTYYYVVTAVNGAGASGPSNEASAPPLALPAAPTGLLATASPGHVSLTWTAVSGATSYTVKRGTASGTEVALAPGVTTASYVDTAVTNGTTYFYVVTAVNAAGESGPSNERSATPLALPAAPTGLLATASPGQVALTWTAVSGTSSYTVKRGTASGGEVTLATGVLTPSYVDTAVTNGTTYFYVITAVNAAGESGPSNERAATPLALPAAPTGLLATASPGQVSLTWTAVSGATSYTVKRGTASGTEVALASGVLTASYVDTAVTNGTTYFYVITAVNAAGESGPSNERAATPLALPAAPTGLLATASPGQVSLTWTAVSGATSYTVKRGTASGTEVALASGVLTASYVDTAVTNGTTYFYVITAVNAAGESGPSNERAATPLALPAAPTGLLATASPGQVSLTWTAVSGATSYTVKRGTASGTEVALASGVLTASYVDTAVTNGTTYFYVITAVNAAGESGPSNERSATPLALPAAPTGLLATASPGQVSLTWTAVSGATSYTVKRGTASGGEVTLATGVLTPSYVDAAVTNGTTYLYVITAVNAAGESGPSNERSATPLALPAAPTGLLATASPGQVSLTWTAVSGTSSYTVKRGTASGGEVTLATGVLTPSYVDAAVTNGTTYFYVITAVNAAGESGPSNERSATPLALPAAPTGLLATASPGQVSLTWTAVSGATSYTVKRGTASGGEVTLATGVLTASYVDTAVTNGTTYFYVVTAVNAAGESGPSNERSATPLALPAAPTGLLATASPGQVSLTWTAVSGATSYTVKRGTSSGGEVTLATGVLTPSYVDTAVTNGTTYFYVITAVNAAGESGPSNERSATPLAGGTSPLAPTGVTPIVIPGFGISVRWTASAGATSYTLKRSTTNGGPYTVVASGVVTNSYVNVGLVPGVTYYYVVSATNAGGTSPDSSQASATMIAK